MGLRKSYILWGPVSNLGYIFSSKNTFWKNFWSEASRSVSKAGDHLGDVIFSHD